MIPSSSLRMSYNYNDDPNPNSSPQEDPPPLSLDHFPSPFLDHHHDHNQLLFFTRDNINSPQPQQLMAHDDHIHGGAYINIPANQNTQDISMINTTHDDHPTPSSKLAPKMIEKISSKGSTKKQRKSGKKDRHSKICTAQGIRDRRMRLSLQIARKFFDLQDMLGFDKASKTIDWLFSKSKKAIKKLSCTTTNDHLPQINMLNTITAYHNNTIGSEKSDSSMSSECEVESEGENVSAERKARKSQTAAYGNSPINAREIRDKARARARERTREKMMIRCLEKSKQFYLSDHQTSTTTYNLAKLGSSPAANPNSNFETVQESSISSYTTRERTNSPHEYSSSHSSLHHQMANVGINIASSSAAPATSCSIFDFQENDALFSGGLDAYSNKFLGFLGNWDIKNSNNSAITTNMVPTLTGKSKTPTSVFTESSKFHHFQSQYPAE